MGCSDMHRVPELPSSGVWDSNTGLLTPNHSHGLTQKPREREIIRSLRTVRKPLAWHEGVSKSGPIRIDLPKFHYPEIAISGKGRDPEKKENRIQRGGSRRPFPGHGAKALFITSEDHAPQSSHPIFNDIKCSGAGE